MAAVKLDHVADDREAQACARLAGIEPGTAIEDADTFEGNALKTARELCRASGLWTLADDSGLVVDALEQLIREELAAGGEIPLARTGKFRLREQAARMGRNPKTGESVMIPARRKIVFTPAKALKDAVG